MTKSIKKLIIFLVAVAFIATPVFLVNAENDTWYRDINVKVTITPVDENKAVVDTLEPISWLKMTRATDNKDGTYTIGIYNRNKENTAFEEPGTYPGISPASAQETYFIDKTTGKITYRGKVWHKVGFMTAGGYNGTGVTVNSSFINTKVKEESLPTLETDGHSNYKWLMFVEKLPDDFDKSELELKSGTEPLVVAPSTLNSLENLKSLIVSAKNVDGEDCIDDIIVKLYDDNDAEVTDLSTVSSDKTYKVVFENVKKEYQNPISTYKYSIKKEVSVKLRATVKLKDDAEIIKVDTELTQTDKDNIFKLLENVPEGKTVNDFEFKDPEKTENGYKVVVTYKYSEDDVVEINVPVIPYTMAEKTTPVVDEVNKKRGELVTENDITGAVSGLPAESVVEVVGNIPSTEVTGRTEVEVKITYKDGSEELVKVTVVVSNSDADNIDPIVSEVNKNRGEKVTDADIIGAISGVPDGTKVEIIGEIPDGSVAGRFEVEVRIIYLDGSSELVNVPVVISNVSTGGGAVVTPNTDNNLPKTGVDSIILVYIILALMGSSILVYAYKRR